MSYQVLARKWRPANFKQMVGQEHVLQALGNALDSNRLHHAYLFSGTRGVGKTTIARIFAKSLNCEQGISSEPCGECSSCCEVDQGRSVDLIALDEVLDALAVHDERKADLVKLRYFAGLTIREAAGVLGISESTADADWAYAKSWLRVHMGD